MVAAYSSWSIGHMLGVLRQPAFYTRVLLCVVILIVCRILNLTVNLSVTGAEPVVCTQLL